MRSRLLNGASSPVSFFSASLKVRKPSSLLASRLTRPWTVDALFGHLVGATLRHRRVEAHRRLPRSRDHHAAGPRWSLSAARGEKQPGLAAFRLEDPAALQAPISVGRERASWSAMPEPLLFPAVLCQYFSPDSGGSRVEVDSCSPNLVSVALISNSAFLHAHV